jgi:hypothetical protein
MGDGLAAIDGLMHVAVLMLMIEGARGIMFDRWKALALFSRSGRQKDLHRLRSRGPRSQTHVQYRLDKSF